MSVVLVVVLTVTALGRVWLLGPGKPGDMSSALLQKQRETYLWAALLENLNPPAKLFNDMRFGGALDWSAPDVKTFIDGRGDLHALADTWSDYSRVVRLEPGWDEILARRSVDLALVDANQDLARGLAAHGWRAVRPGLFSTQALLRLLRPSYDGPWTAALEVPRGNSDLPWDRAELYVRKGSRAESALGDFMKQGEFQSR